MKNTRLACFFVLLSVVQPSFSQAWGSDPGSLMKNETSELNRQFPIMVDSETEMRSAAVFERAIVFKYVMINETSSWLKSNYFISEMKKTLPNTVCSDPWSRDLFKKWPTLIYSYSGKNGGFVGKVTVSRTACP